MPVLVDVVRRVLSHEGPAFLIGKRDSGAADRGQSLMDVAAIVRRLEASGFSHDQAISLSEVFQDEVIEKIATKEYVDLVIKRKIAPLEVALVAGWL